MQDFIDMKVIQFTLNSFPNVIQSQIPTHGDLSVNAIEITEVLNLVMDVNLVTTLLLVVKEYLIKKDVYPSCSPDCMKCEAILNG